MDERTHSVNTYKIQHTSIRRCVDSGLFISRELSCTQPKFSQNNSTRSPNRRKTQTFYWKRIENSDKRCTSWAIFATPGNIWNGALNVTICGNTPLTFFFMDKIPVWLASLTTPEPYA